MSDVKILKKGKKQVMSDISQIYTKKKTKKPISSQTAMAAKPPTQKDKEIKPVVRDQM